MPSLKAIRKRIVSVRSTQKITRAMKMVAGARLTRAQQRITELRPYAIKTRAVLCEVTAEARRRLAQAQREPGAAGTHHELQHPLLAQTPEKRVIIVVLTSDRGLCGSFNTTICKLAEKQWRQREADGQQILIYTIGRKGRDYFRRRQAPIEYVPGVWEDLGLECARTLGRRILEPFLRRQEPFDAIYFVYNEFKSAISQRVVAERLLPVPDDGEPAHSDPDVAHSEFLFEPDEQGLLDQLLPMYVQVSILRALYESMASELGARMTAMDSATKNATEMISTLTLRYNRARQAAITKELMEIIGGSEALKG